MIIFCGGTRDISRNESKSRLSSLKEFAQRTNNTNAILLKAPHRYDLPPSSCVNIEVKLFNKRMRSLMTPFNHVKVVSISTEREHRTRHGLHLNKKGKHWVTDNLVKEIKNSYLPLNKNPPIVLQWKNTKENATHQISPATSIRTGSDMEPANPSEVRSSDYDNEPPKPGEIRSSDWIIEDKGAKDQDDDSKQQPTQTPDQINIVPPQQVKVPNRVSSRQKKIASYKI
jgi:hypothetical protein